MCVGLCEMHCVHNLNPLRTLCQGMDNWGLVVGDVGPQCCCISSHWIKSPRVPWQGALEL